MENKKEKKNNKKKKKKKKKKTVFMRKTINEENSYEKTSVIRSAVFHRRFVMILNIT